MAAGDQTWDPSLEDKMVRWTSAASEKEIDRAARQLGGERQFKKRKPKPEKARVEAGVRVHKGSAARIDARPDGDARGGARLPGVGANRRDVDSDAPQLVLPEDSVATDERRALEARGVPSLRWHGGGDEIEAAEPPRLEAAEPPRLAAAEPPRLEAAPPPARAQAVAVAGARPPPKRRRTDARPPKQAKRATNLLSFED
jgi:hypothetical protein